MVWAEIVVVTLLISAWVPLSELSNFVRRAKFESFMD
jgi:hypothetical protein